MHHHMPKQKHGNRLCASGIDVRRVNMIHAADAYAAPPPAPRAAPARRLRLLAAAGGRPMNEDEFRIRI
ncbi:hypothetical protein EVAR_9064_1 [Eumeta japonica]|uniref:Uncharacterized protein n=1 Tax=Eumeta variegata TaxID=151549 RepID=A0A4C1TW00_EUMVA|nr:hypothetical protein EVAR_9064_1 [Eumeta japonica]